MKRGLYVILIIIFVLCLLKACIRRDIPDTEQNKTRIKTEQQEFTFPPRAKTVTINGVDFLQSQTPVGKFGGELILSTFGEGPKTFNPFTSKDATSSQMAGMMFDGLFTTDAKNGEIIPKLAKGYEIKGNEYYVYLRKGLTWSDGKPITADDVMLCYVERYHFCRHGKHFVKRFLYN